jgi:topoisomerase-4 subunit A
MIDLGEEEDIVALFVHQPGRELLLAATSGHGFRVPEDEVIATKRSGKQIMNVVAPSEARVCVPSVGDSVATVGENRKVLVFPLEEVPQMTKGRGVILQRYKDGGLSDAKVFALDEGLKDPNGRTWTKQELGDWRGARASAGRIAPKGFPKNNRLN